MEVRVRNDAMGWESENGRVFRVTIESLQFFTFMVGFFFGFFLSLVGWVSVVEIVFLCFQAYVFRSDVQLPKLMALAYKARAVRGNFSNQTILF